MGTVSTHLPGIGAEDVLVDLIHDRLVCVVFGDTESCCAWVQLLDTPQGARAVLVRALLDLARLHRGDGATDDERQLIELLGAGGPDGDESER